MTQVSLSTISPYVMRSGVNVPEPAIISMTNGILRDFLRKSSWLRRRIGPGSITEFGDYYAVVPQAGEECHGIISLSYGSGVSAYDLSKRSSVPVLAAGEPLAFIEFERGRFQIVPSPDDDYSSSLSGIAAFIPSWRVMTVDEYVRDRWLDAIVAGVVSSFDPKNQKAVAEYAQGLREASAEVIIS